MILNKNTGVAEKNAFLRHACIYAHINLKQLNQHAYVDALISAGKHIKFYAYVCVCII